MERLVPKVYRTDKEREKESSSTGCPRNYRKSVLYFCIYVLGRLRDLKYIFVVTYGPPSTSILVRNFVFRDITSFSLNLWRVADDSINVPQETNLHNSNKYPGRQHVTYIRW